MNPKSKAISTTKYSQAIGIERKCYIIVIPCALVIRLIYTPSALGPAALGLWVYISGKPLMPMVYITIKYIYIYIYMGKID